MALRLFFRVATWQLIGRLIDSITITVVVILRNMERSTAPIEEGPLKSSKEDDDPDTFSFTPTVVMHRYVAMDGSIQAANTAESSICNLVYMDLAPFMLKTGFRNVLSDLLKSTRMVTTWLIIVEILMFAVEVVVGNGFDTLTSNPFLGPTDTGRYYTGGSCSSCIADGNQYFRVFTPLLLHSNVAQLVINVFAQRSILTRIEHNWRVLAVVFYIVGGCMSTMVANAFTSTTHLATATSATTGMLAYYICILVYRAEPDTAIGPKLVQSSLLYMAVLVLLSAMAGGSALICVISMIHGVVAATLVAKINTQSRLIHAIKALGYVLFLVAYFSVGYVCIAVFAASPATPSLSSSNP